MAGRTKPERKTDVFNVRLGPLVNEVQQLAQHDMISASAVIRQAVRNYIFLRRATTESVTPYGVEEAVKVGDDENDGVEQAP